jgi:hypothetical protein
MSEIQKMNQLLDYFQFKDDSSLGGEEKKVALFNQYLNATPFHEIKEQINSITAEVKILNNLIATNDLDLFKILMDYDIKHNFFINWNYRNESDRGHNPLLKAIYYDNLEALNLIINHTENGASIDFNIKDIYNQDNIIMMCFRHIDATSRHSLPILKTILNYNNKANVNLNFYEEDENQHGLMNITLKARGDINLKIKMLHLIFQEGYDINHSDSRGRSFLSELIQLSEDIEDSQLFKNQYTLFQDKIIINDKNRDKILFNTAYSYSVELLQCIYSHSTFEKIEYIEYIKNNLLSKPSIVAFSPDAIKFFNQKHIELIEKEKSVIEEQLESSKNHSTHHKKVKI